MEPVMQRPMPVQWLIALIITVEFAHPCGGQTRFEFSSLTELRTDEGRFSFGTIVSMDVVAWSSPAAQDLLIARLWDGVYLYPSADLQKFGEPIRLCDQLGHAVLIAEPADWNGDGRQEAIGADRRGNIFCLNRVGEYPLEYRVVIDSKSPASIVSHRRDFCGSIATIPPRLRRIPVGYWPIRLLTFVDLDRVLKDAQENLWVRPVRIDAWNRWVFNGRRNRQIGISRAT